MREYYKKQEIKDHLDDYLNENLDYLKENYPTSWKDDLHHYAFNEDYFSLVDTPKHIEIGRDAYQRLIIQNVSGNTKTLLVFYKLENGFDVSPLKVNKHHE